MDGVYENKMKINEKEKKLINILINYKLKEFLYLTDVRDPIEFFEKYEGKESQLLKDCSWQEKDTIRKLFDLKRKLLDK